MDDGAHLDRLLFIFLLILNYTALAMTLSFFVKRGALTLIPIPKLFVTSWR